MSAPGKAGKHDTPGDAALASAVAPRVESPRVPSGMLPRFGLFYRLSGLNFFFRNLRLDPASCARITAAAARGPVVYVLHTRSVLDWLALNRVLVDSGLPLPVLTNGMDARPWMGLADAWRAWLDGFRAHGNPEPVRSGYLTQVVAEGRPTCVFLLPPRESLLRSEEPDPLPALLEAQARCRSEGGDCDVQVVPVVVLWNRFPEPARTEVGRFLLGTEDHPGVLGKLLALAKGRGGGDAVVQAGEAVPLGEFVARYEGEPLERQVKTLRLALRRFLYREAQVVRGPRSRPRGWIRRQVLESRQVRELVAREAAATGRPAAKVARKVEATLDHVAARFSFGVVSFVALMCRLIWNRIYSGIDVRDEDLDRIRDALRAGTPVLVPCHRSHLDYLLISSLLYERDIVIPHIVAGENLSFFPLGAIFRRCGAFFIRRSFTGDRIFPVVFARYLHELIRQEVPIEFFIEGGRSRTGKLLPPKLGVLSMILEAAAGAQAGRAVTFLPIYVGYEQIAEENAYARELAGARKEKENVGQVVKATGVLTKRYGKVYLRVGEPLRSEEILQGETWAELGKARRNELLMAAGERLLHRINVEAVALPTALVALAVLAHPRRGLRHDELRARVDRLRDFLAAANVREGSGMDHLDGIVEEAVTRFVAERQLQRVEGAEVVYRVVPERRVNLEYYKNSLLHAFAPAAYYAAALRAVGDEADPAEVARLFRLQQFLLRYEFVLDPDADTDMLEARAIAALGAYGALEVVPGLPPTDAEPTVDDHARGAPLPAHAPVARVRVADGARLAEIANMTANFLESYLLVARTLARETAPVPAKELPRRALALGRTMLAADELRRPEALSLLNLENAVRAFTEEGVLVVEDGAARANRDELETWIRELGRLLPREDA
jgi:glycerol-3-phosphate O-acyltransferase